MLEFGEKLSLLPSAVTERDISALREYGFTDRDILSITLAAAYRNYIVRVADSLGVELHKNYSYSTDVLEAFNVSQSDISNTIYGDRLSSSSVGIADSPSRINREIPSPAMGNSCWIDTNPIGVGVANLFAEGERLTAPYPLTNLASAISLRPDALKATLDFAGLLGWGGSGLGPQMESFVGLVVATVSWIPYMGVHHAQTFLDAGGTVEEIRSLLNDRSVEALDVIYRDVGRYCEKIAREPNSVVRSDVDVLRSLGFGDEQILSIAAAASLESFLCRVVAGLGVSLEDHNFTPEVLDLFMVRVAS